jgi:uncharacterized protein
MLGQTRSAVVERVSTFSEQLWYVPAPLSESMLHGVCCGLLCGAPGLSAQAYRRALIDLLEPAAEMHEDELDRFIELAAEDLDAPDLSFAPLLPDHDVELTERLACLAQWAGGFVAAFEEVSGELDGDALDAFDDIGRIADVDAGGADASADADAEAEYVDVCEHLKVAVLLIRASVAGDDEEPVDDSE